MKVEIISVGTALLTSELPDVYSKYIASCVRSLDFDLTCLVTVGDDEALIADALWDALRRAHVAILVGPMTAVPESAAESGAAPDDPQDPAGPLAQAVEATLAAVPVPDAVGGPGAADAPDAADAPGAADAPDAAETPALVVAAPSAPVPDLLVRAVSRVTGRRLTETFPRIEGATVLGLPREAGSYGLYFQEASGLIFLLPNNRRELSFLADTEVLPRLERAPSQPTVSRWALLRTAGLMRSSLEERLADLQLTPRHRVSYASYAGQTDIRVYVEADTPETADSELEDVVTAIQSRLGDQIYGFGQDRLEQVLLRELVDNQVRLVLAECNDSQSISRNWRLSLNGSKAVQIVPRQFTDGLRRRIAQVQARPEVNLTEVCKRLAEELRVKANTDLSLMVYNNIRPGGVQVLSVLATPFSTTIRERSFGGHPENIDEWSATIALVHLRGFLLAYPPERRHDWLAETTAADTPQD